jgi:hypothetical protein
MLKKASLGNSAAQVATAIVESNTLITYTTPNPHSIFEGAKVTVTGITATTGVLPNVTSALVYKVNNATSFSVKPGSDFTYGGTFPATLAVGGDATVYSINGSLMSSELLFAQPKKLVRPQYFNFISPEISLVASGNGVLVTWDALGVANPQATVSVERILGTTTTVISTAATSVSTSASYVLDGSLTSGVSYTYRVSALNSISSQVATSSVTTLYISAISALTAVAKPNTANAVSLSWGAPETNAAISQYEIDRSSNGGSSWSALATTSSSIFAYEDTAATANGSTNYTYRIRAKAAYAAGVGGDIYSSYTSSSAILPFFISTTTPTAATVASTANSLLVSWSAVSAATPAITSYELQRASSSNNSTFSEWSSLTLGSPTATSYSDIAASSAIYYKYRIRVLSTQLTSAYVESNSIQAFYLADPISAPVTSNSSTSTTSLTVTGSYTANPAISGYNIQRALTSSPTSFSSVGATNFSITLPYVDTSVSANTSYLYQVKAKNSELTTLSWSASSNSVLSYSVPFNPTNVNASSVNATSVNITWSGASVNSVNTPITSYTLGYKLTSTTTYTTLTGISAGSSSYTLNGLTTDSAYDFRILAVNAIGTATTTGAIVATATPVRVAGSASLSAPSGASPYFNTGTTLRGVTQSGRSVTVQISTNNSTWSDLTTYTSSGTNDITWTADTTAVRYFRMVVAQDATYTQTISGTVTIDPVNNYLGIVVVADTYDHQSVYNTVLGTGTVTVEVTDVYGSPVEGATITWSAVQFPASSYTSRATGTTNASGQATLTLSSASPALDLTTSFEFFINATKTNYTLADAGEGYYTIYVNETDAAYANISRSYAGSNAVRTGQGDFLYFGYYDTSWDTQKSAMGFTTFPSWEKLDASNEVNSATLRLSRGNASGTNPGTVYIGTHENASGSSTSWDTYGETAFGTITPRQQSYSHSDDTTVTVTLNSAIRDLLYGGGVRGFTLGPPTSTSLTYYSKVYGHAVSSNSLKPYFTVNYNVVPSWNVP